MHRRGTGGRSGSLSDQPIRPVGRCRNRHQSILGDAVRRCPGSILVSNAVESPWLSTGARLIGLRD